MTLELKKIFRKVTPITTKNDTPESDPQSYNIELKYLNQTTNNSCLKPIIYIYIYIFLHIYIYIYAMYDYRLMLQMITLFVSLLVLYKNKTFSHLQRQKTRFFGQKFDESHITFLPTSAT